MNDYITITQLRSALDAEGQLYPSSDTDLDTFLGECITRASRLIDSYTGRQGGVYAATTDEETRYYSGNGEDHLMTDEFLSIATLEVAESGEIDDASGANGNYTEWANTTYLLYPVNASQLGSPYTGLEILPLGTKYGWFKGLNTIKLTARFGYAAETTDAISPIDEVQNATLTQATRLFLRARQGFEDVGAIEALGQLRYVKKLDPDVQTFLYDAGFKRVAI